MNGSSGTKSEYLELFVPLLWRQDADRKHYMDVGFDTDEWQVTPAAKNRIPGAFFTPIVEAWRSDVSVPTGNTTGMWASIQMFLRVYGLRKTIFCGSMDADRKHYRDVGFDTDEWQVTPAAKNRIPGAFCPATVEAWRSDDSVPTGNTTGMWASIQSFLRVCGLR
jgi:hypothetical protein